MNLLFFGDSITDMSRSREAQDKNCPFLSGMGYFFLINAELKSRDASYNPINKGIEPDIEFSERAHAATKKLQDNIEPETSIWKKILAILM